VRTGGRGVGAVLKRSVNLIGVTVLASAYGRVAFDLIGGTRSVWPSMTCGFPTNSPYATSLFWTGWGDDHVHIGSC